jgi:hypothetical protein
MIAETIKDFSNVYSPWFGKPVIMLVVIRHCQVPMPCRIVGESAYDVRVCLEHGWELNVRKESILAVEETAIAWNDWVN